MEEDEEEMRRRYLQTSRQEHLVQLKRNILEDRSDDVELVKP